MAVLTRNIVSDDGAVGDGQEVSAVLTIASGSPNLSSTTDLWVPGDAGKSIVVNGAASSFPNALRTTILTFTDSKHIVLAANASQAIAGATKVVAWGTNNAAALSSFKTWALANQGSDQILLTFPAGFFLLTTGTAKAWVNGVKDLIVSGYGATLSNGSVPDPGFFLGGTGIENTLYATRSGRTQTAAKGATSVTMINPSDAANFTVGKYVLMSGFDLQGVWQANFGYPPNWYYNDWVKITDITAGVITFDRPLRYTYKSTWPQYDPSQGGPATLWVLPDSWDASFEYQGLTLSQSTLQTYATCRNLVYRDVTFTGLYGGIPTQNKTFSAYGCTWPTIAGSEIEMDKLCGDVLFDNCEMYKLGCQSASIDTLTLRNCTVRKQVAGTPKAAYISGCALEKVPAANGGLDGGTQFYGHTNEIICDGTSFQDFSAGGTLINGAGNGVNVDWNMVGDTIIIPNTDNAQPWAVPGTNCFWAGAGTNEGYFKVSDVTQDATNIYVKINKSYTTGSWPDVPLTSGKLNIRMHPCPKFTMINCIGDPAASVAGIEALITSLNSAPNGAPLWSYQVFTYDGSIGTTVQPKITVWGLVSSISFNVTRAYVGAAAPFFHLSQFDNWSLLKIDGTTSSYAAKINVKTAGERVITLSGVTGTQTGDTGLAVPDSAYTWFMGQSNSGPEYFPDASGGAPAPSVTVTIQTSQGIIPDEVAPLRLRLHA